MNYPELYFRFASLIDKIFKGAKPASFQWNNRPSSFCRSTTKTVKALGLAIPQSILLRADEVIH